MVREAREKQGFIAGGVRVYGQTKHDYNVFISTLGPLIGNDPFWNAYFCRMFIHRLNLWRNTL